MQELIAPEQSERLVVIAALLIGVVGAVWGYRAVGVQGLAAALCGPLVWGLWQLHKYVTRYDPQSGYFGLDKVNVLLFEIVLFVSVGVLLGWAWNKLSSRRDTKANVENAD